MKKYLRRSFKGYEMFAWLKTANFIYAFVLTETTQKMKFSNKDFFSKCDQKKRKKRKMFFR